MPNRCENPPFEVHQGQIDEKRVKLVGHRNIIRRYEKVDFARKLQSCNTRNILDVTNYTD